VSLERQLFEQNERILAELARANGQIAAIGKSVQRQEARLENMGDEIGDLKSHATAGRISMQDMLEPPTNGLTGRLILLVEDEPFLREVISLQLRSRGARVVAHGTAEEAQGAFGTIKFDAAVIDLHLPDGSGVDVARSMRAIQPHSGIVMISGFFDDGMLDEVPHVRLEKPFEREALRRAIFAAIGKPEPTSSAIASTLPPPPATGFDPDEPPTPLPTTAPEGPRAKREQQQQDGDP
jgi:CheY-like chemotaxis protein